MKNAKQILVGALMVMSISTYADVIKTSNNDIYNSAEEKSISVINKVLPTSVSPIESPAPQKAAVITEKQYTASQKAAIVELELKHVSKN